MRHALRYGKRRGRCGVGYPILATLLTRFIIESNLRTPQLDLPSSTLTFPSFSGSHT